MFKVRELPVGRRSENVTHLGGYIWRCSNYSVIPGSLPCRIRLHAEFS